MSFTLRGQEGRNVPQSFDFEAVEHARARKFATSPLQYELYHVMLGDVFALL
jgi:hypothetical protein